MKSPAFSICDIGRVRAEMFSLDSLQTLCLEFPTAYQQVCELGNFGDRLTNFCASGKTSRLDGSQAERRGGVAEPNDFKDR